MIDLAKIKANTHHLKQTRDQLRYFLSTVNADPSWILAALVRYYGDATMPDVIDALVEEVTALRKEVAELKNPTYRNVPVEKS